MRSSEGYNSIANLANALKKWIDCSENFKKLAIVLTTAKERYCSTRTGGKERLPELKKWGEFNADNARNAFFSLLAPKASTDPTQHQDGWKTDGHYTLGLTNVIGCASLNVLIIEEAILSFKECAKQILESDDPNKSNVTRQELLRAYLDLEKNIILTQGNAQEIYTAIAGLCGQPTMLGSLFSATTKDVGIFKEKITRQPLNMA